jgi:hypothetical protein
MAPASRHHSDGDFGRETPWQLISEKESEWKSRCDYIVQYLAKYSEDLFQYNFSKYFT